MPHRIDARDTPGVSVGAAASSAGGFAGDNHDLLPGLDQLLGIHAVVLPSSEPSAEMRSNLIGTMEDARMERILRRMPLDLRVKHP